MNEFVLVPICATCGQELDLEEFKAYTDRCETCMQEWLSRVAAWRQGGEDAELDRLWHALNGGTEH